MLDRYTRKEMANVWSLHNQYASWLKVEVAAVKAWGKLGKIPATDVTKIEKNAQFNENRIAEIEAVTHHDVIAFTRDVSESLGEEKKWVHYGLTSTDVVDTAQGYRLKEANVIIRKDLEVFKETLATQAKKYKYTVIMGRTHGVHAEPMTFGLKLARWYSEIKRDIERFEHAAKGVEAGKISGAVGTFANVPPEVEGFVCAELGLNAQEISTQILPRDLHAEYIATLALIATSIEEFATEIRGLQKSEVREVEEHFAPGQKGSSAMPHKRNPIGSENVSGLARVIRGHVQTAYEDVNLWHERDISHSSAERIILPDTTILVDYILHRMTNIIGNLTVFPEHMKANMHRSFGLIYSQRVLLKLIDAGLSREEAYDQIQPLTAKAWDEEIQFKPLVEANPVIKSHLSPKEIDDAFDYRYHLKNVDYIFNRVGLD
ncbi:adenylosuccinate lyase [Pediococcus ethanolidurans]|uniref:adenylosuccinate lyase n=1 Tax=Pediococcus ethanolidurans TaxID=319653 RepID=UPI002953C3EE|nr:adenylosuccinate lyase [Pediococcus ethanolidurans]MDV7719694.1 adenylosuccinate lyase [Pediococcus ethanolidurans]